MGDGLSEGRKSRMEEKKNKRRGPPGVLIAAFQTLRHSGTVRRTSSAVLCRDIAAAMGFLDGRGGFFL